MMGTLLQRLQAKNDPVRLSLCKAARWAGLVLAPLVVFVLALTLRVAIPLRPVSIAVRYSFTLVFPALLLLVYLAFRLKGYWGSLLSLTLTMALFGLAAAGLWASAQSEDQALSGLLPWNDSAFYYVDGLNWLEGLRMGAISSRRPLLPLLFSALLALAGRNLQAAVALLTGLMGLSVYLAARELQRTHGAAPAALAWVILFFFARRYTATITTEALGIIFGSLGFALLWRSVTPVKRRPANVLLGLFLLTLGSLARPGALLVLPLALYWAARVFRSRGRLSFSYAGLGAAVIAAGMLLNQLFFGLVSPPDTVSFSNFPYLFYGMAVGGKGWTQYRVDHPEVLSLSEAERSAAVMQFALEEVRQNPANIANATLKQYGLLVSDTYYSLYSFITYESAVRKPFHLGLYLLCLSGLLAWAFKRNDPFLGLVGAGVVGTLLSVPFAPPMDANRMRVYAATIPVLALLPAMGLSFWLPKLRLEGWAGRAQETLPLPITAIFALLALALTLLAPLAAPALTPNLRYTPLSCPAGEQAVYLRYGPGTSINVHREAEFFLDWTPDVHAGRFRDFLHNTGNLGTVRVFERIEPPATILLGPDLETGRKVWLVMDGPIAPQQWGILAVCGHPVKDPGGETVLFWAAEVQAE